MGLDRDHQFIEPAHVLVSLFDGQTGAFRNLLMREGLDPVYGFRPMRFVIQKRVDNRLAEALLVGLSSLMTTLLLMSVKKAQSLPPQRVSQARAA